MQITKRWLLRFAVIAGVVLHAPGVFAQYEPRAQEAPAEVRRFAFVDLPAQLASAQLDVRSELTSVDGSLAAASNVQVGLGAGLALGAGAVLHEDQVRGEVQHAGMVEGGLSYGWRADRRVSELALGYQRSTGEDLANRALGRIGLRAGDRSWAAAIVEVGYRDRLDGTVAVAVGTGDGPVRPSLEIKAGRCLETCAMGAAGIRVQLPNAFALGLAVVSEVMPQREVGMSISLGWSNQADATSPD